MVDIPASVAQPDDVLTGLQADRVQPLLSFPVIGLLMGLRARAATNEGLTPGNGGPPRPPGWTPTPDTPGGVQLAGTDADGLTAS